MSLPTRLWSLWKWYHWWYVHDIMKLWSYVSHETHLKFTRFFPQEKYTVPGENPVKNAGFPRQTPLKLHSKLCLCTFLCKITHVPPPSRFPTQPSPIPALPCLPSPAQPALAPATEFFPHNNEKTGFFPHVNEKISKKQKNWYKKRILTYLIKETLPAVPRSTERCALASCWAAPFCIYIMLHKLHIGLKSQCWPSQCLHLRVVGSSACFTPRLPCFAA